MLDLAPLNKQYVEKILASAEKAERVDVLEIGANPLEDKPAENSQKQELNSSYLKAIESLKGLKAEEFQALLKMLRGFTKLLRPGTKLTNPRSR